MHNLELIRKRIIATNYRKTPISLIRKRYNSIIVLLKEALRRLEDWDKALELEKEYNRYHHLFDIVEIYKPDHVYNIKEDASLYRSIKPCSTTDRLIISYYIKWEIFREELTEKYNLPNPYEPLIMMFERGTYNLVFLPYSIEFYPNNQLPIDELKKIDYDVNILLNNDFLDSLDGFKNI